MQYYRMGPFKYWTNERIKQLSGSGLDCMTKATLASQHKHIRLIFLSKHGLSFACQNNTETAHARGSSRVRRPVTGALSARSLARRQFISFLTLSVESRVPLNAPCSRLRLLLSRSVSPLPLLAWESNTSDCLTVVRGQGSDQPGHVGFDMYC